MKLLADINYPLIGSPQCFFEKFKLKMFYSNKFSFLYIECIKESNDIPVLVKQRKGQNNQNLMQFS